MKGIRLLALRSLLGACAALAVVVALPKTSHALLTSYDILLSPAFGPSGSGSFLFDDTAGQVLDLQIALGDFGPFMPVGTCGSCPIDFSPGDTALFFDLPLRNTLLQQLELLFQGVSIRLLLEADGSYGEFNGRAGGTYAFMQQPIPEPGAALCFLTGFGLVGAAQRRLRPRG